jgi:hypothetical protein
MWFPSVHLVFARPVERFRTATGLSPAARELAARHLHVWTDPKLRQEELAKMRSSNAEWDFMTNSFLVWSMGNMALRDPAAKQTYLEVMDAIIDETLRMESERGMGVYLMAYASTRPFLVQPPRSLFLDSEIALMLATRRLVEDKPSYRPLFADRTARIVERMNGNAMRAMESYPDECWTFDHTNALAAMRIGDAIDGTDHSALIREWLDVAKRRLIDPTSGMLVSSYTLAGRPLDGPEGSTLWMVAHGLQAIDPAFAADQYARARRALGRTIMGFSYATEWPRSHHGYADVDSGPIIPLLDVSAGSSGMAFIGASAFDDGPFLASLAATLDFAAFPTREGGRLRYAASNQVGDAALLYASVLGPVFEKARAAR